MSGAVCFAQQAVIGGFFEFGFGRCLEVAGFFEKELFFDGCMVFLFIVPFV